jgi:hypothetical protein
MPFIYSSIQSIGTFAVLLGALIHGLLSYVLRKAMCKNSNYRLKPNHFTAARALARTAQGL